MGNSPFRFFAFLSASRKPWGERVCENLAQLLAPVRAAPASANGAPIHLLKFNGTGRRGHAQSLSLVVHAGAVAGILFLATNIPPNRLKVPPQNGAGANHHKLLPIPIFSDDTFGRPSLGDDGGGGNRNPIPATKGYLPPRSSFVLMGPHMPQNLNPRLAVNPVLADAEAPPLSNVPITQVGLPWMKDIADSGGQGGPDGLGNGRGRGMGDREGNRAGWGHTGLYAKGMTRPACQYCPDPTYSDEARQSKLQGVVTLEVLVGADGRAAEIHVLRGLGYGLDERAEQTVRTWRFVPARDAAGRGVPTWVTVEVSFHLY